MTSEAHIETAATDDENIDTSNSLEAQHPKTDGGMRRVDSLELHRLRLPHCASRSRKRQRKSNLSSESSRTGLLSFMGLGSSSQMVKA